MHEIFLKYQYKCAEVAQSSISKYFFSVDLSFLRIFQPQNDKQCWLIPLSFKISLKDTSFHIFINSIELYLSQKFLKIFSQVYIFYHVWKYFSNLLCSHSRKCIEYRHFYSWPSPLKTCPNFLSLHTRQKEVTHSPRQDLLQKSVFPNNRKILKKLQNLIRKYEDDL